MSGLCECGCGENAPLAQRNNARVGQVKGRPLRFVSGHNKRGTADLTRFVVDESGCWLWTGALNRKGYGRVHVDGVHRQAHRAVYESAVGPVDRRLHVDHLCRVRRCVNPDHLEPVTPGENERRKRRRITGDPLPVEALYGASS